MSSTLRPPSNGNDGDLNTMATTGGTGEGEANPWWQIDFGSSKLVGAITFHNRDDHCASRLFQSNTNCAWSSSSSSYTGANQGATFGVGDTPCSGDTCSSPQCGHLTTPASDHAYTITCDPPLQGRYAYVMLPRQGVLHFMEFEAHEGEHRCMSLCRLLCARRYALGV